MFYRPDWTSHGADALRMFACGFDDSATSSSYRIQRPPDQVIQGRDRLPSTPVAYQLGPALLALVEGLERVAGPVSDLAVNEGKHEGRYAFIFPQRNQAKDTAWRY